MLITVNYVCLRQIVLKFATFGLDTKVQMSSVGAM